MKKYILAIDIGTSSTKVVAFSLKGELLEKESASYSILTPENSFQEQDPKIVYAALMKATKSVIEICGKHPTAITFSSAMHSLIAVDEKGKLLTNSIIWADGRSQSYADELRSSDFGVQIYQHTGTPIHPMSPLCKIAWIRDHQSDVFQQTHRFISIKEYVFFKWFDRFIVDESIASATGLFDIEKRDWYKEALDYCGIKRDQLSEVVPTTEVLKNLNKGIAEELGIAADTPIVIGASDGCLANLGAGVKKLGKAVISVGTSAAIRMTHDQPLPDADTQLFNYILDEKYYVIGGASNNGGVIYEWLTELLEEKIEAEGIEIGADRLLFLPYLLGERAPIWDTNARGAFIGLHTKHTKAHLLRAVLEGIVMNLYQIAQALEKATCPIKEIYASGGFTQNDLAMQILADVFNATVFLQSHEEGTALGAAILGMQALEEEMDLGEEIEVVEHFKPNSENHERYQKIFNIWKGVYQHLKEDFKRLQDIELG